MCPHFKLRNNDENYCTLELIPTNCQGLTEHCDIPDDNGDTDRENEREREEEFVGNGR